MTVSLTHSTPADGSFSATGATAWNAQHVLTQDTARLLGRTTAGVGATEEISVGSGLSLSAGTLSSTGGTPGGSDTQIQFNNSGVFGGASGLTTNGTELTIASGTKTASAPFIDATQTWNSSGITFTGFRFNATDTASAAASLLLDLQVGGSSRFRVGKSGGTFIGANSGTLGWSIGGTSNGVISYIKSAGPNLGLRLIGDNTGSGGPSQITFGALDFIAWRSTNATQAGSDDLFLTRRAAANLRFGAADAAAPVAQTLSVQSVVAGTSNTAGANFTITGSQGTGTGAGGSIIFQVAPAGGSGTAQNALTAALTLAASKVITVADTFDLEFSTGTGTKIATATTQKIGFWNATPIVQPTTAVAAATVAATGTGDVVAASTTFDGYTIPQIVKALRNAGLLA